MLPSAAKPFTARTARSVLLRHEGLRIDIEEEAEKNGDVQPEDLRSVSGLNTVTLTLSCVACDDGKVLTSDGEDCTSIFSVWVES